MLHLARKAFHPGRLPFPLLHVDTTWKFREMITFRDRTAEELGWTDRAHQPGGARPQGINPFDHGSKNYTDIMKTQALKQALTAGRFDAAFGGARRDEEKSRAKERVFSFRDRNHRWDPKNQRPSCGTSTTAGSTRASRSACSRCPTGPSWTSGSTSLARGHPDRAAVLLRPAPGGGARRRADHGRRRPVPVRADGEEPEERWVRFRTLGCYPLSGAVESTATPCPRSSRRCCWPPARSARAGSSTTTSPARWRRRSARGTSDGHQSDLIATDIEAYLAEHEQQGPAALPHLRQRRRRQVDPDRPAAARLQDDLRGPAGRARGRTRRRPRHHRRGSTWRC
jgi:sulfate adenylyltransferase subunit 2